MFFLPYDDINPTRRVPLFTYLLIALNVAAYVYLYWVLVPGADVEAIDALKRQYDGCSLNQVLSQVRRMSVPEVYQTLFFFEYGLVPRNITAGNWQIDNFFTSMFLHGGLAHLAGNMLFLWITGDNLEDRFGYVSFIALYLLCGLAAAITQIVMNPAACIPMVGASGAIAGVMGAYMVLFPRSKIKVFYILFPIIIPGVLLIDAIWWLGLWILFQFVYEFASQSPGGVAHWAHIGGFAAGFLIALLSRTSGFVRGGVDPEARKRWEYGGRGRGQGRGRR
jgi:membrane associated rhomboid family serine protease